MMYRRSHTIKGLGWVLFLIFAAAVASCGGGSSSGAGPTTSPPPPPPTAEISGLTLLIDSDNSNLISLAAGELSDHRIFLAKSNDSIAAQLSIEPAMAGVDIIYDNEISYLRVDTTVMPVGANTIAVVATNEGNGLQEQVDVTIDVLELAIVASGSIGSRGGTIASQGGLVGIHFEDGELASDLGVEIFAALTSTDDVIVRLQFDRDVSTETAKLSFVSNPNASTLDESMNSSSPKVSAALHSSASNYILEESLDEFSGLYAGSYRLDPSAKPLEDFASTCDGFSGGAGGTNRTCIQLVPDAARLSSSRTREELSALRAENSKELVPVLFVHGYQRLNRLGGGTETWEQFPDRVAAFSDETVEYIPFEFQWRTNASFRVVADDLARAIERIHRLTGSSVRVIAHSYGGVLVRTLIQGQAQTATDFDTRYIRSLLTLGSPHFGNFDDITTGSKYSRTFPGGQDGFLWIFCGQISCYQAGENVASYRIRPVLTSAGAFGEFIEDLAEGLANGQYPEDIPTVIGIGLRYDDGTYGDGDGVISYAGQRFELDGWLRNEDVLEAPPLSTCDQGSGDLIAEVFLGAGNNHPGPGVAVEGNFAYVHSDFDLRDDQHEYRQAQVQAANSPHDSVERFKNMIDPTDPSTGGCVPENYTQPSIEPSLMGTTVKLTAHYPERTSPSFTVPYAAVISSALEFPFGALQDANNFDNLSLIRSEIDVGENYIHEVYIDAGLAASGNFNGWIFEFTDEDGPVIVNATLDTERSTFTENQIRVDHDANTVFVDYDAVFINSGSVVYIRLELANP